MVDRLDVKRKLEDVLSPALRSWGFDGQDVLQGVIALVDGLKSFREEGRPFRPNVYVVHSEHVVTLQRMIATPHCETPVHTFIVDTAPDEPGSYLTVLKTCAPLAVGEWSIVIRLEENQRLAFGLMRRPNSVIDEMPDERLRRYDGEVPPFLLVRSLADDVVQLTGRTGDPVELHFWGRPKRDIISDQEALLARLVQDVPWPAKTERVKRLLATALREASTSGFGFLVAVQAYPFPRPEGAPDECAECIREMESTAEPVASIADDGVFFANSVPLALRVSEFIRAVNGQERTVPRSTIDSYAQLRAWQDLIAQCLSSDGIVLFDTCARLLGYRIFVRPSGSGQGAEGRSGARKRAFNYLRALVDRGDLVACFYQSQDGATEMQEAADA